MMQFRKIQPDDAEVLRDGKWVRYDHTSLVVGDLVRLYEGDVVPADCVVLSLGMEHVEETVVRDHHGASGAGKVEVDSGDGSHMEMTVDSHVEYAIN